MVAEWEALAAQFGEQCLMLLPMAYRVTYVVIGAIPLWMEQKSHTRKIFKFLLHKLHQYINQCILFFLLSPSNVRKTEKMMQTINSFFYLYCIITIWVTSSRIQST
jgi:hypothetical protein